jgi:hypothetical protein
VKAPENAAVDLLEHAKHAPAQVQQRLLDTASTHLLPLAWLKDLRVTARFDLDGEGGVRARTDVGAGELAIRFEGAEHGVPGLPNEVVHWPDKGQRADAPSYLLLPETGRQPAHQPPRVRPAVAQEARDGGRSPAARGQGTPPPRDRHTGHIGQPRRAAGGGADARLRRDWTCCCPSPTWPRRW